MTEIPRTAQSLVRLAEDNGWTTTITHARGTLPGRTPKLVDSVAVRLRREGALAALWLDGKFWCGLSQSRTYTLTEIKELVRTSA